MALDHALASQVEGGTGVLRLYRWSRPTVSFGRNEPAANAYGSRVASGRGLDFVRRPTGGRAVLHDRELTYAVVVPLRALGGPRRAYRRINECLAEALRAMGWNASVTANGRTLPPDAGPCFGAAAPGEVVVDGRKRIGSAQARIGNALLQHGSILLGTDQQALRTLAQGRGSAHVQHAAAAAGTGAVAERDGAPPTALEQEHPRHEPVVMSIDEVARAVAMSLMRAFGGRWAEAGYERRELVEADRLEQEIYGRDAWTWRR